jgi:hypothetical protein
MPLMIPRDCGLQASLANFTFRVGIFCNCDLKVAPAQLHPDSAINDKKRSIERRIQDSHQRQRINNK